MKRKAYLCYATYSKLLEFVVHATDRAQARVLAKKLGQDEMCRNHGLDFRIDELRELRPEDVALSRDA